MPKFIDHLKFIIRRDRSGLTGKLYPRYDLTLESNSMFIVASQKMNTFGSAHYIITLEWDNMNKDAPGYVGKVRSGTLADEYNLYGTGDNPSTKHPPQMIRDQYAGIYYV